MCPVPNSGSWSQNKAVWALEIGGDLGQQDEVWSPHIRSKKSSLKLFSRTFVSLPHPQPFTVPWGEEVSWCSADNLRNKHYTWRVAIRNSCCPKRFMNISPFKPFISSWGNWGTKSIHYSPEIWQLISGIGLQTQAVWLPSLCPESLCRGEETQESPVSCL